MDNSGSNIGNVFCDFHLFSAFFYRFQFPVSSSQDQNQSQNLPVVEVLLNTTTTMTHVKHPTIYVRSLSLPLNVADGEQDK